MFIRVQFRDFEITSGRTPYTEGQANRICYWATIFTNGSIFNPNHLSKEGTLDIKFDARLHRFYSLEEIEEALSLYYKSPIKLNIPRIHKEII